MTVILDISFMQIKQNTVKTKIKKIRFIQHSNIYEFSIQMGD